MESDVDDQLYEDLSDAVYAALDGGDSPDDLVRQVKANVQAWLDGEGDTQLSPEEYKQRIAAASQ